MFQNLKPTFGTEQMRRIAREMRNKYNKYWGGSNLLISIAANLRNKMKMIEYYFPTLYTEEDVYYNINYVRESLYNIYKNYVVTHKSTIDNVTYENL